MVSLAERRGRSALGVYQITSWGAAGAHRQQSAPPVSKSLSRSMPPTSPLLTLPALLAASDSSTVPDGVRSRIQALDDLFRQLRDAVDDLIADDADWLEEQYGLGQLLGGVHAQHQALVAVVADQHAQLQQSRQRSEQCAALHDQQRRVLESLELTSWTTPELLQDTIASLERELQRLDPGRSLAVPDALLKVGPVQRLIALRFQRQDDLLFVMRRRLAQMSFDQPLAECLDEFRSLRALLDELQRLRQQNAQLQLRERRFDQSALLRRRPLRQCSTPLLRALVVALQNELSAVCDIVAELEPGRHPLRHLLSKTTLPSNDGLIDVDRLYTELTGARSRSADRKPAPGSDEAEIAADDLDVDRMRTSLKQVGVAIQTAEFVSESAARAARDAVAFLERQLEIVERTVTDQQDLIRDGAERLRDQRVLNLKLTGVVQELLRRDGAVTATSAH